MRRSKDWSLRDVILVGREGGWWSLVVVSKVYGRGILLL